MNDRDFTLALTIALLVLFAGLGIFVSLRPRPEPQPEQTIHVFTHTVDDREIRCVHFSQYGLSCDWTYGEREGLN